MTTNKYRAVPTTLDGVRFASKREAARYADLRLLQKAGQLTDLRCQVAFDLRVNNIAVAIYVADFTYHTPDGARVVEDVKCPPTRTPLYRLKKKLMKAVHNIDITEVE